MDYDSLAAREKAIHDQFFDDDVRHGLSKYYSVTSAAYDHYRDTLKGICRGRRVLEYGCGPGSCAFMLSDCGAEVLGIDISEVAIRLANGAKGDRTGLEFREMDAHRLELEDGTFDIVCGTGILHHLDLEKALSEVSRVLKPGGKALFVEPLGGNRLFNLYRALTPKFRTPDEHPLTEKDLQKFEGSFDFIERRFFVLLALLAVPFRHQKFFQPLLRCLARSDWMLFGLFPGLRYWAWITVVFVEKRA